MLRAVTINALRIGGQIFSSSIPVATMTPLSTGARVSVVAASDHCDFTPSSCGVSAGKFASTMAGLPELAGPSAVALPRRWECLRVNLFRFSSKQVNDIKVDKVSELTPGFDEEDTLLPPSSFDELLWVGLQGALSGVAPGSVIDSTKQFESWALRDIPFDDKSKIGMKVRLEVPVGVTLFGKSTTVWHIVETPWVIFDKANALATGQATIKLPYPNAQKFGSWSPMTGIEIDVSYHSQGYWVELANLKTLSRRALALEVASRVENSVSALVSQQEKGGGFVSSLGATGVLKLMRQARFRVLPNCKPKEETDAPDLVKYAIGGAVNVRQASAGFCVAAALLVVYIIRSPELFLLGTVSLIRSREFPVINSSSWLQSSVPAALLSAYPQAGVHAIDWLWMIALRYRTRLYVFSSDHPGWSIPYKELAAASLDINKGQSSLRLTSICKDLFGIKVANEAGGFWDEELVIKRANSALAGNGVAFLDAEDELFKASGSETWFENHFVPLIAPIQHNKYVAHISYITWGHLRWQWVYSWSQVEDDLNWSVSGS